MLEAPLKWRFKKYLESRLYVRWHTLEHFQSSEDRSDQEYLIADSFHHVLKSDVERKSSRLRRILATLACCQQHADCNHAQARQLEQREDREA